MRLTPKFWASILTAFVLFPTILLFQNCSSAPNSASTIDDQTPNPTDGPSISDGTNPDAYNSRPTNATIVQATQLCQRGTTPPPTNIIGISDPHTLEPGVISLIKETGVKWVRAEFHWSVIQKNPDSAYDWASYDAMVDSFNQSGIKVLGIITYVPTTMPADWSQIDQHFQRFTKALVQRYSARGVHHWEVFNEPNLTGYGWLLKGMNARDFFGAYTLLLARASKIIHENDPQSVVVLGGLASDNHAGVPAEETMDAIYGYGAKNCFDVFAFHPYGYQNQFPAARARVNAILAKHADTGKVVWFNEYGWTDYSKMDMTVYNSPSTNPMMAVFSQRQEADGLFWFSARDYSSKLGTPTFGLADFNFNKRKSFDTFKYLVGQAQ